MIDYKSLVIIRQHCYSFAFFRYLFHKLQILIKFLHHTVLQLKYIKYNN